MGIVHTPRVLATIAKGMMRQSKSSSKESTTRLGVVDPYKYYARAGLFDVDYLGHLNNAAYFSHAEYARWEMSAVNGWLPAMMKNNAHYYLTSASCRYRAEIRPLFRKFEIQTVVAGMDDKNLWIYQSFRHAQEGDDRVRAQVIVKGAIVQKGKVIDPRQFLKDKVGVHPDVIDAVNRTNADASVEDMIASFEALDKAKRNAAALDDERASS